jgi:hypothetical protein
MYGSTKQMESSVDVATTSPPSFLIIHPTVPIGGLKDASHIGVTVSQPTAVVYQFDNTDTPSNIATQPDSQTARQPDSPKAKQPGRTHRAKTHNHTEQIHTTTQDSIIIQFDAILSRVHVLQCLCPCSSRPRKEEGRTPAP